jgi:hypothetical protein
MKKEQDCFGICLNCKWIVVAKSEKEADELLEAHNIKFHYGNFHWTTIAFEDFNYPKEFDMALIKNLLCQMTRQQKHEWIMGKKEIVYKLLPLVV